MLQKSKETILYPMEDADSSSLSRKRDREFGGHEALRQQEDQRAYWAEQKKVR